VPARSIGQPRRAARIAKNKVGGIGNGGASGQRRQLTRKSRARVSAYSPAKEIHRAGRAVGLVAMNCSRLLMNIRASVFAASPADWLCVAFSIAKLATKHDVGVGAVSV
jgi:hypothetical protein